MMFATLTATLAVTAPPDFATVSYADFRRQHGGLSTLGVGIGPDREAIFEATKKEVLAQNAKYKTGKSTWWAAINEYADWTDAEFAAQKLGALPVAGNLKTPLLVENEEQTQHHANIPATFDWRDASPSITTPVKNQASCGSCWALYEGKTRTSRKPQAISISA